MSVMDVRAAKAIASLSSDDLLSSGTVTVSGARSEFGFAKSRLYEWMQDGTLPYSQVGSRRLIPRVALRLILSAGLVGATQ